MPRATRIVRRIAFPSSVSTTTAKADKPATDIRRATAKSATCSVKGGSSKVRCSAACRNERFQSVVNSRRGGDHFAAWDESIRTGVGRHATAGLLDQQQSRRGIPGMHVRLVERIEAAGRNMREHQRTRARILDGGARSEQRAPQCKMAIEIVPMDVAF